MADLTPHAADGGLLSSVVTQVGTAMIGAGVLWRLFVSFGRQDRAAKMEGELRDELRRQNEQLSQNIATIAHERNEAVQVKLQLETELRVERERRLEATQQRDDARAALARVQGENEQLRAANHRLTEEAAIAEASAERGCAPAPVAPPAAPTQRGPRPVPGERPWGR